MKTTTVRSSVVRYLAALIGFQSLLFPAGAETPAKTPQNYASQIQAFRAERVTSLTAPDGWLTLVGLKWLQEGANPVGSAPQNAIPLPQGAPAYLAVITQSGTGSSAHLRIAAPPNGFPAGLKINDAPAIEGPIGVNSKVAFENYAILVLSRGERLGLRIKDSNAPTRTHFSGLHWYAPDQKYRVKARWIPYDKPHAVTISTIIGTTLQEEVPGKAEFTLEGKTLDLEPVVEDGKLFFVLRDKTSTTTTYKASRFLYTDPPTGGLKKPGDITLDFNRLVNPPCAYTAFATCPLPTQQNRLDAFIPAGEKRYHP